MLDGVAALRDRANVVRADLGLPTEDASPGAVGALQDPAGVHRLDVSTHAGGTLAMNPAIGGPDVTCSHQQPC